MREKIQVDVRIFETMCFIHGQHQSKSGQSACQFLPLGANLKNFNFI
jgi:hypothetical protein